MPKKEFKIGEVFQFGLVKLRVEEGGLKSCNDCYLDNFNCYENLIDLVGRCDRSREDKTDVIFIKMEE